jgi:hypothetical protein
MEPGYCFCSVWPSIIHSDCSFYLLHRLKVDR